MGLRAWLRRAAVKYLEGMAQMAKEYHRSAWSLGSGLEDLPGQAVKPEGSPGPEPQAKGAVDRALDT